MKPTHFSLKMTGLNHIDFGVLTEMSLYSIDLAQTITTVVEYAINLTCPQGLGKFILTSHMPSLTLRRDSEAELSSLRYFVLKTIRSMSAVWILNM